MYSLPPEDCWAPTPWEGPGHSILKRPRPSSLRTELGSFPPPGCLYNEGLHCFLQPCLYLGTTWGAMGQQVGGHRAHGTLSSHNNIVESHTQESMNKAGADAVVWPLPVAPTFHMGTGSSPGCSTSDPAPC